MKRNEQPPHPPITEPSVSVPDRDLGEPDTLIDFDRLAAQTPLDDEETALALESMKVNTDDAKIFTNLDLKTWRGRAMLVNAGNPPDISFDNNKTARILATHFVCMPDTVCDQKTGEIKQVTRTVLIAKDGSMYRTSSEHVPARMRKIYELWTTAEWEAGIPFVITERRSKDPTKSNYHDVRVDLFAPQEQVG